MRYKYLLVLVAGIFLYACTKDKKDYNSWQPMPTILLKEITVPLLPLPYDHFEYGPAAKSSFVFLASDSGQSSDSYYFFSSC